MKIEYDREAKAVYIEIDGEAEVHSTIEVTPSIFVDIDKYDMATGIELLHPAKPASLALICQKVHVHVDEIQSLERALRMIPMMTVQQNQLTSNSTVSARGSERPLEFL